uniref:DOMON domain-containing protein n=1 Tax=Romanomermis culicivorax TaxID=13658 RepID=A0A915IDF5_ROMCU
MAYPRYFYNELSMILDDSDECLDVIVAQMKDNAVFIGDFFGNGLSTPVLDDDWGIGRQSFTYVSGRSEGAYNIVTFRRKLVSEDLTDYNIERNSPSSVIAVAKNPNNELNIEKNARNFLSMYDSRTVDLNFFDVAEEIDTESTTKKSVKINPVAKCKASYGSPKGCVDDSCAYFVEWGFEGEHLSIKLEATMQPGTWTGVGFSEDGFLNNSNIVVAILNGNNAIELTERFVDRELRLIINRDQNIFDIKNAFKNGRLLSSLKLSLTSYYNQETRIYQSSKCFYILYPISGGKLSDSGEILPFAGNVEVERSDEVCGCRKITTSSPEDTKPKGRGKNDHTGMHTVTTYSLKLKLLKPSDQTKDETIRDVLKRFLIKTLAYDSDPGSLKVDSLQIKRLNGSFLADVELSSPIIKDKELLKNVLFYEAANNPTYDLKIDPYTIETEEVWNASNDKTRLILYVLIGTVIILIVFTILICLAFYFCIRHDKVAQPKKRFFSSYPNASYPISKSTQHLNMSRDKYDLSKSKSRTSDRYSANQTSSHYLSDFPTVAANSSSYFADHGPIYPNAVIRPKSKRNRDQVKNSYPRY